MRRKLSTTGLSFKKNKTVDNRKSQNKQGDVSFGVNKTSRRQHTTEGTTRRIRAQAPSMRS